RARSARAVVDQDDAEADSHLGSGETDTHLVVHGLEHVGQGLADLGRDGFHRLGLLPEDGITVAPDAQDSHVFRTPRSFTLIYRLLLIYGRPKGFDLRSSQGTTFIRRLDLSLCLPHRGSGGGARGGSAGAPRE